MLAFVTDACHNQKQEARKMQQIAFIFLYEMNFPSVAK